MIGANFGMSPVVTFGGNALPSNCSDGTISYCDFTLPQGFGTNINVVITANGRTSLASRFSYSRPSVFRLYGFRSFDF